MFSTHSSQSRQTSYGSPEIFSHARHTHVHAHTLNLKVNNLLKGENRWEGFSFSRTRGRAQLSPMKLASSACPAKERSTTVALTPLPARAAAACPAISQDTGSFSPRATLITSRADRAATHVAGGEGRTTAC